MNLTNLRSIHMPASRVEPAQQLDNAESSSAIQHASHPPRFRKTPRSPIQEFQARIAVHGATEPLPDALRAILLYEHKQPLVSQKGEIAFDLAGVEYKFWHEDCATCHPANAGKRVRIAFDRDDLSCIFVLSEEGAYVETVPAKGKSAWFGKDTAAEIARYRKVANHVYDLLDQNHAFDNKAEHDRTKTNAEKLQYLNVFPAPADGGRAQAPFPVPGSRVTAANADSQETIHAAGDRGLTPPSTPRFTTAEEIAAAARAVRAQKENHREHLREEEDLAAIARSIRLSEAT